VLPVSYDKTSFVYDARPVKKHFKSKTRMAGAGEHKHAVRRSDWRLATRKCGEKRRNAPTSAISIDEVSG
jgi:hypothetical protein